MIMKDKMIMKSWKTRLCGDNRMNFYGWIATALLVIAVSLCLVVKACFAGATQSPEATLLIAIYLMLCAHFGIAVQNYTARVAKNIDSEQMRENQSER